MAVLVLLYHRTPVAGLQSDYDVELSEFCEHITALVEGGYRFIRFSETVDEFCFQDELFISVTFDDGHKSNIDAFEFLSRNRIVPTSFIVSEWCRNDADFISSDLISALSDACEFGSHGATHADLTRLSSEQLSHELISSKAFLEATTRRPVTTMALPGGVMNRAVVRAAKSAGYTAIGNSVSLLHRKPAETINRVTIRSRDTTADILQLARASHRFWLARRIRLELGKTSVHIFGNNAHQHLARLARKLTILRG